MKRDLELIRDILFTIENQKYGSHIDIYSFMKSDGIEEFCNISFHIQLLLDEDMIEIVDEPIYHSGNPCEDFYIERLTTSGCDYLDSIRDENIWNQTKNKAGKLINSVTLSTISSIAQKLIFQQLNI